MRPTPTSPLSIWHRQKYADAAAANEKALQINDKDYLVWANLVACYQWLKESAKEEASRKTDAAAGGGNGAAEAARMQARSRCSQLCTPRSKDRQKAMDRMQASLALAPDDPYVLSNAADVYEILGDRAHALEYLEKALQKGLTLDQVKGDPELQAALQDPKFHTGKP